MEPIRIVLCDDHRIVIDGLQSLLAGVPDMDCVGTALHGEEALYLLGHVKVDVLVTDLDMPDMDGYELIAQVKRTHPEVKGLVLSMLDEPAMIKRAIDLGVDGYVVKDAGRDEVLLAIREVHEGRRYFGSSVTDALLQKGASTGRNSSLLAGLSDREIEVLAALAEGLGNREIGERLFISPRTVDTHRTNLMKKLDTHHVAGLVRIAIKGGLVHP